MKKLAAAWPRRRQFSALASTGLVALALGLALALGGQIHFAQHPTGPVLFAITSPANGATVSDPVQLAIAVQGAKIGWPYTGNDHLHVSVDGGPAEAIYKNRVLELKLAPGRHTVAVELAGPNHAALMLPQYVAFTVH
jgi:hypothetical protein